MRWLLIACVVAFAETQMAHAQSDCLLFCDEKELSPAKAIIVFNGDLGAPLPDGVKMVGMLEGGFQDRFIQVRLTATASGVDALMALRGKKVADLTDGAAFDFGPERPIWWDVGNRSDLKGADFGSPSLANLMIGVAAEPKQPGQFAVYFFGFDT